ncbi:hypothetical protein BGW37DRAFT_182267 [Umbelopsis sp. PMI_123]|nr:hypothetical protein BGW37DRAFT_182267 [Umbelopsis sp. PMI_123]
MIQTLALPDELLSLIFQNLGSRDILSCSYVCWTWNKAANPLLYYNIFSCSQGVFENLIRTITPPESSSENEAMCPSRQKQLGALIRVIRIHNDHVFYGFAYWYLPALCRLAAFSPNVHTVDIYEPSASVNGLNNTTLNWQTILGKGWPHLKALRLVDPKIHIRNGRYLTDIDNTLYQLRHLDIMHTTVRLESHLLGPLSPTNGQLKSLKIRVNEAYDYALLKRLLQSCKNTLDTLVLSWHMSILDHPSLSLDDLILELPNLKSLGFTYSGNEACNITSFGEKLERLDIIGNSYFSLEQCHKIIGHAMMKTTNLKTLSLESCPWLVQYIPMVIDVNRATLQTLYFVSDTGYQWISTLAKNSMPFYSVTTLCFECLSLNDNIVLILAAIFPNVQFLSLAKHRGINQNWILSGALSHFQHLKGVDKWTFHEVVDQNNFNYAQYDIRYPLLFNAS